MKKLNVLVYSDISLALLDWLKKSFDVTVCKLAESGFKGKDIDIAILQGEEKGDVHPDYYNETVGKHTNLASSYFNKYSTIADYCAIRGIPVVGIEEGAHYLTVNAGGSLIQHVTGHDKPHVIISSGYKYTAPSDHHQMMYPYDLPSSKYNVIAYSRYFESDTYLNGRNEEKNINKDFLEPEIVSYENGRGKQLAIQGNPIEGDSDYRELCMSLVQSLLK